MPRKQELKLHLGGKAGVGDAFDERGHAGGLAARHGFQQSGDAVVVPGSKKLKLVLLVKRARFGYTLYQGTNGIGLTGFQGCRQRGIATESGGQQFHLN